MIPGEGPIPCKTMLLGDMPGIEETKLGRPFVGKAGRELNRYLNGYICPLRQDLYLSNLKRRMPDSKEYVLHEDEERALWNEIDMVRPTTIVTLGAHVTKYFLGDRATMESYHGIPHVIAICASKGCHGVLVPGTQNSHVLDVDGAYAPSRVRADRTQDVRGATGASFRIPPVQGTDTERDGSSPSLSEKRVRTPVPSDTGASERSPLDRVSDENALQVRASIHTREHVSLAERDAAARMPNLYSTNEREKQSGAHCSCPRCGGATRVVGIFAAYNPAATLHSPNLQAAFSYDMRRLGLYLKGKLEAPPIDNHPGMYTDDSEYIDPNLHTAEDFAVDTEGWITNPWCASYSWMKYRASVVRAGTPGWKHFASLVRKYKPRITLHNSLYDLAVLREMGLDLDEIDAEYDDTMIMAYLLGIEPQGLKPLAYRHAGATHDDYSDVVAVPNVQHALNWMVDLLARLSGETDPVLVKCRKLVERMLEKPDHTTLRKRWSDCRTREVLTDELSYLPVGQHDPPEATLDDVPLDIAVNYAARDADLTGRVKRSLRPQVTAMGLDDVYAADLAIVPMVDRMQAVGLDTDVEHFHQLSAVLAMEIEGNLEAITRIVGRPLNPNSGDQVAELLFDELKLHEKVPNLRIKRTKSGERLTTNDKVLEALEGVHTIVPLIVEGRELKKLKGTYSDVIPTLVRADGRLHPNYRLTRADTGRLTAGDPNVLAFPKHSRRGKLVRMGFRAGPGRVLGEWDYGQIEMRVMAHDSGDERMIAQFLSGHDFHKAGAADRLHKAIDLVTYDERFRQKAINFGTLMGITEYGLLDQMHKSKLLHVTLEDCAQSLSDWFVQYPGCARYISDKHAEARRYGYVRDMWGRLRWLEGIHSTDKYIVSEAERQAQATPIQSGAQGIIKRGMALLWPILKGLRSAGIWVECLLQVHDALVLEYDPAYEDVVNDAVTTAMVQAVQLSVPVTVDSHKGVLRLGEL